MNNNELVQKKFNNSLEVTNLLNPVTAVEIDIDYNAVVKDILAPQHTLVEVDAEKKGFAEVNKDPKNDPEILLNLLGKEGTESNSKYTIADNGERKEKDKESEKERDSDGDGRKGEKDGDGDNNGDREGREIEIEGGVKKLLGFLDKNDIFNLPSDLSEFEAEIEGGKKGLNKLLKNEKFNKLLEKFGLKKDEIQRKLKQGEVEIERKITLSNGSTISLNLEAGDGEFELSLEVENEEGENDRLIGDGSFENNFLFSQEIPSGVPFLGGTKLAAALGFTLGKERKKPRSYKK